MRSLSGEAAAGKARSSPGLQAAVGVVVTVSFMALVLYGTAIHEPWWDEAQAWLIARDATFNDLFAERLAYEGHPPLWYLILAVPAKLHWPYESLQIVAALIATAAVALLQRQTRVPLALRVLLPFTFYFAYQYSVVARSYVLVGALLIAVAAIYERRHEHFWLFVALLLALASASIHGTALAVALALLFGVDQWRARNRREAVPASRLVLGAVLFVSVIAFLAVVTFPAADISNGFRVPEAYHARALLSLPKDLSIELLFGYDSFITIIASRLALLVLLYWFWRTHTLMLFALTFAAVLVPSAVYFSPWHEGIFFFVLVTALLVSFQRPITGRRLRQAVTVLVVVVLLRQIGWTAASYEYDASSAMTGSRAAADYIRRNSIDRTRLVGMGLRCVEIQPYFSRNVFANYHAPGGAAYWDWSVRNLWPYPGPIWLERERVRWMERQLAQQPDYVLVSSGFHGDRFLTTTMARRPDYRRIAIFRGMFFWKRAVIESIMFHLYKRTVAEP